MSDIDGNTVPPDNLVGSHGPPKALPDDFLGRFREIVSDPLNLLIRRHPLAGCVESGNVVLHNGVRVAAFGESAYYGRFSEILVINRGVHEPLEEFLFQCMLRDIAEDATMLELGAYWGHYSMWFKSRRPRGRVWLVEPEAANIAIGQENFTTNGLRGVFINSAVGRGRFSVDEFLRHENTDGLSVLHADIQGAEVEMLHGAEVAFRERQIDHVFISTHSQQLHEAVLGFLDARQYRVEISSDLFSQSSSFDGLVYASSPLVPPLVPSFRPMGRLEVCRASVDELSRYVCRTQETTG